MTAKRIKSINKEISRLKSKMIRLKNEVQRTSSDLSGMPHTSVVSDKVGKYVAQITDIQREIQSLEILKNSALNKLSRDIFEENCLFMRLILHYSWTKIAIEVGGNNTADSIRKMCERYRW